MALITMIPASIHDYYKLEKRPDIRDKYQRSLSGKVSCFVSQRTNKPVVKLEFRSDTQGKNGHCFTGIILLHEIAGKLTTDQLRTLYEERLRSEGYEKALKAETEDEKPADSNMLQK